MEIVVTDYRLKDHEDLIDGKQADEWLRLVKEGGFSALEKMAAGKKVAFGYPKMSNQLKNALKWLCPEESSIDEYQHDIPPVEALGLISLAKMTGDFTKVYIRFHDKLPDPVAIGVKGKKDGEEYLIASWGPEKMPEEAIVERFRKLFAERLPKAVDSVIRELQNLNPDECADSWLESGYLYNHSRLEVAI